MNEASMKTPRGGSPCTRYDTAAKTTRSVNERRPSDRGWTEVARVHGRSTRSTRMTVSHPPTYHIHIDDARFVYGWVYY